MSLSRSEAAGASPVERSRHERGRRAGIVTAGFHHVALVARDAARSIHFYHDLLGFPYTQHNTDLIFGSAPGHMIAVSERRDARKGRWGVGGVHHVALGTEDPLTQLKWKRWLTDHGVSVSGPYDRGWFTSIYFADPDGQILEIATNGPGYDLDEPIDRLGQQVAMPKPSQLRGQRDEAAIAAATYPEPIRELDMTLDGIHHVTGLTNDVEKMGRFYEDTLGLRLVKRSVNQDDPSTPHLFWANYDGTRVAKHSSITQFGWPRSDYVAREGFGQTHHVAFRARDASELQSWRDKIEGLGIEVSTEGNSIFFRAPDASLLEIATD